MPSPEVLVEKPVLLDGQVSRERERDLRHAPCLNGSVQRVLAVGPLDLLTMQLGLNPPLSPRRVGVGRSHGVESAIRRLKLDDPPIGGVGQQVDELVELVICQSSEWERNRVFWVVRRNLPIVGRQPDRSHVSLQREGGG